MGREIAITESTAHQARSRDHGRDSFAFNHKVKESSARRWARGSDS